MLERFEIDHADPSWPVNRWLTAMVRLFRTEIESLIRRRDEVLEHWVLTYPGVDAFEDRELEVMSETPISLERQVARVRDALRR